MLGGFFNWPLYTLDASEPFDNFQKFRSLFMIRDKVTIGSNWEFMKNLTSSTTAFLVGEWEKKNWELNFEVSALYSSQLGQDFRHHFENCCPFDGASFAVVNTASSKRTQALDVAKMKFAVVRYGMTTRETSPC